MSTRGDRVRALLIGPSPLGRVLVVTPIPAIFKDLVRRGWTEEGGDFWWRRASSGDVNAVLTPQGGAIADLGLSVPMGTRVELVGYAGSLDQRFDVGDVLRPTATRLLTNSTTLPLLDGVTPTTIATSSHLLASYDAGPAITDGTGLVDLESAHLAAAVARAGGEGISVRVLVTDRFPDAPFYAASPDAVAALKLRRRELVDELVAGLA